MPQIVLAKNRLPQADIIFHGAQAEYAAIELRNYLGRMTGAAFETLKEPKEGRPCIWLEQVIDRALGDDGFQLESEEKRLLIRGGKRGVIYGAYEVLERLGCRFFTSNAEKIPVDEEAVLPEFHETQVPRFEYRFHNTAEVMHNPRFAARCRLNGSLAAPLPEMTGGSMHYVWFVHSMGWIFPVQKFGKFHPEYYAMRDGKRFVPDNAWRTQMCLTNPEVLKIAIERVRKELLAHPDCRIISISQNDNFNQCTCPACRKADLEEGSPSGTMLRFVNAIATALKDEFPDVVFDTLAYQYTRPVTHRTKPAPNVCVRLCSIESCFSHPFTTCDDRTRDVVHPDGSRSNFISDLRDWGKVCNRIYIWDYVTCFAHFPAPHPNWHALQPNMQAFAENNVKGVFSQGNPSPGGGPDLVELRQYLVSKLLWDPYCDLEKHMTEFLDFYYGKAAPFVREYIETLCRKCEEDDIHVGFNDPPTKALFSEEMLDRYWTILKKAEAAVSDEPLLAMRIRKIEMSIEYLRLKCKAMLQGKTDTVELNDFFTRWYQYGFTRIHEWVSPEAAHQAFLKGFWRGEETGDYWFVDGSRDVR